MFSLVALQAGGHSRSWRSAYVLCTLLVGFDLMTTFVIWWWKGARNLMTLRELFAGQRTVAMAYGIAFISEAEFRYFLSCMRHRD
jgi:hypothetical protein